MDNVYNLFPTLKSRIDMLKPKRYIFIYLNKARNSYCFELSNSIYEYNINLFCKNNVIIAYRKSGKIFKLISLNDKKIKTLHN